MPAPAHKHLSPLRLAAIALAMLIAGAAGWAALAPVKAASREELFVIPPGTSARRMAGEAVEILPQTIRLTLGLTDILVLRNRDSVPHIFGPALIMPGQSFSLPFAQASTYGFQCSAHADGQLSVIVEPAPTAGWQRLRWRWREFMDGADAPGRHDHQAKGPEKSPTN
jgi:hypothetical protein